MLAAHIVKYSTLKPCKSPRYTLSYSRYIQPDREMGGNKYKINMNKMCRENFINFQLNFYTIEHCLVNLYHFNFE